MWLFHTLHATLRGPMRFALDVKTIGAEHVPPRGPILIACNHASFLDPFFLALLFPRRPIRYLINARWYHRSPRWRFIFDANGVLPATPRDPIETIGRVVRSLERGDTVGVFPEGAISYDGRIQRTRTGVGWMAALSGAPVIPCGLRGNFDILPRQRRMPRRHPLRLHVGETMRFPGGPVRHADPHAVHDFVAALMARVCTLAGQSERADEVAPRVTTDLGPKIDA